MKELTAQYAGDWKGFITLAGRSFRIIFRIRFTEDGPDIRVDNLDSGDIDHPFQIISLEGDKLQGITLQGAARFEGTFQGEDLLAGEIRLGDISIPVELSRDNPAFKRFDMPRLDQQGEPVIAYVYQPPQQLEDGLLVATLASENLDPAPLQSLMETVLAGKYPQTHSILASHAGRLVLEEYFYGQEKHKLHVIQSITKSITSILIGIALERGEIASIDQPVYSFFPERSGSRWVEKRYPLTLRHVLTMTAALDWEENLPYTDTRNDNTAMNRSGDWIGYVLEKQIAGEPGEKYMYTSGLSILLGGMLKNATGLYVDEYAQKYLFSALEITNYTWFSAPDGTRHTGGGLSLLPRDLLKIGILMQQKGKWHGKQVVPSAWVTESTRQQTAPGDYAYGYQWHIRHFEHSGSVLESACGLGYGGQCLFIIPDIDLVVALNAGLYIGDSKPFEKLEKFILPAFKPG